MAENLRDVTVVMPTRNRWACVRRVLPTYLSQPEVRQVILIDDAGTDPPEIDLGPDAPVRIERVDRRRGAPHARNLGVGLAETPWILFSDDDVFLAEGYLASALATQSRSGADIVAGRRIYLLEGETAQEALARCGRMDPHPFDSRFVEANFSAPIPEDLPALHLQTTALVRRAVTQEVAWNEIYQPTSYREETDFFLRAAQAGFRLMFSRDAVCFHLAPAETATGGQRAGTWWKYELGVVRNNRRFLALHYDFLYRQGAIDGPRWLAELRFMDWRLRGGLLRALYRRYYGSSIRTMVHRGRAPAP